MGLPHPLLGRHQRLDVGSGSRRPRPRDQRPNSCSQEDCQLCRGCGKVCSATSFSITTLSPPLSHARVFAESFSLSLLLLLPRLYHSEGTDLSLSDPQRGQHDLHRDPSPRLGSHGRSRRQRFSARLQAATEHRRQLEAEEDVGRSARWSLGWEILVREKLGAGRAPRREGCRRWEGGQNRIVLQLCCITTRGDRCEESEIRNVSELEPLQPRQPLGRRSTASLSPTLHSSSRRLVFASPAAYQQPISRSTSTTTAFLRSEMPRSRAPATAPSMQQSR